MKIKQKNINFMIRNARLRDLYDGSYLTSEVDENFQYIKSKFFRNEMNNRIGAGNFSWVSTAKTLNVGTGMFPVIADVPSAYVGDPICDMDISIEQATRDYAIYGLACVWLESYTTTEGRIAVRTKRLPTEGYFFQDGYDHISRIYSTEDTRGIIKYYILIQKYYDTYTENKLYSLPYAGSVNGAEQLSLSFRDMKEVPLDTVQDTMGLSPEQKHNFGRKAIFVIREDEDVIYPHTSKIEQARNIVYSMDRKKVMFDCEFLKNVESFILIKGIPLSGKTLDKYNKGKRIDFADLGRIVHGSEGSSIEFVQNTNSLIKEARDSMKDDIGQLSTLTKIPLDFLGSWELAGSIGRESRALVHGAFVKEVERIRSMRDRHLPEILLTLSKINWYETKYTRPDVFPSSDKEVAEEMAIALSAGIISRKRAMMTYLWVDAEEAEEEMEDLLLSQDDDSETNGSSQPQRDERETEGELQES